MIKPINNSSITQKYINDIVKESYNEFKSNCLSLRLFGKEIYFSTELLQNCSIDFWHMASLENKDLKKNNKDRFYYNIKPCNNTIISNKCSNCTQHTFCINIRKTNRDICIYRMKSVKFFKITIERANELGLNVKIWKLEKCSNRRQKENILKIRFQENEIDYLIILKEKENIYYFITAYLVFEQREKNDLDKEYNSRDLKKIK